MSRLRLLTGPLRGVRAPAGALLLAAGLAFTITAAHTALQYADAVEVAAVLSAKEVQQPQGDKAKPRYLARYRLMLSGEDIEAEELLPQEVWEARAPGGVYVVLFVPEKRRILPRPWSGDFIGHVIVMGLLGVVLTAVGGPLAYKVLRELRLRVRLRRHGTVATAAVVEVFPTASAKNGVALWQLRYRYRDALGAEHEGTSDLLFPAEASMWKPGASTAIVFDPGKPEASAWLGREDAPGETRRALVREARSRGRSLLQWSFALAVFFAALIIAAILAELVPGLKALDAWIEQRHSPLLAATLGTTVLGTLLMVGTVLVRLLKQGRPLDHTGVEQQRRTLLDASAAPWLWRTSTYRVIGKTAGAGLHDEFSLAEFKRAIAAGAVFRDPLWRWRAAMAFSALVMSLGIFGVLMVVIPLELKLLAIAAFVYALARISWAAARAQP